MPKKPVKTTEIVKESTTETSKLQKLLKKAELEGWRHCIKTKADEKALLKGYTFNWDRANAAVDYIETFMMLPGSTGTAEPPKPFILLDWQKKDIIQPLFGWVRPDGTRRFRSGYVEIPKKNGKSALAAAILLYMLDGDGEGAAQVYSCANAWTQAMVVWKMAQDIVENSPMLRDRMNITESAGVISIGSQAWLRAWSSDSRSKDGPSIYCIVTDELHEWANDGRKFWDKIKFGGIARKEPLVPFAITTAGTADGVSLCLEQHNRAEKILSGFVVDDLSFFARIYCANLEKIKSDPNYWKTEECWKEANPSYGTVLDKESFEIAIAECENDPSAKNAFFRYRLGVWVQGKSTWMDKEVWDACVTEIDEEELSGQECWAAFDLSSIEDTSALVLCFPYFNEELGKWKFKFVRRIYCPEESITRRSQSANIPYNIWANEKKIIATPGPVIDHAYIYSDFEKFAEKYNIKMLSYDRRFSDWIIQHIERNYPSIPLDPFGQGTESMSSPTKAFMKAAKLKLLEHQGCEVVGWQMSNAVAEENSGGEVKLNKAMSKDKIDVTIAKIMCFSRANLYAEENTFSSYYNSEEYKQDMERRYGKQHAD